MNRTPLPNRRPHEAADFYFWGRKFIAGFGWDGNRLTELWLNSGKSGEQAQVLAQDAAVVLSLALQYGAPLEVIAHALKRHPDGSPQGPIGAAVDLAMVKT